MWREGRRSGGEEQIEEEKREEKHRREPANRKALCSKPVSPSCWDRETQKQRRRHRDTDTGTHRQRDTERHRHREGDTDTGTHGQRDTRTDHHDIHRETPWFTPRGTGGDTQAWWGGGYLQLLVGGEAELLEQDRDVGKVQTQEGALI